MNFIDIFINLGGSAFAWQNIAMLAIACALLLFAAFKKQEPLLLIPLAFGMLLANLPQAAGLAVQESEILDMLYAGVRGGALPCLLFFCIGMRTDFGPLLAHPSGFFFGAVSQLGVALAFAAAAALGFAPQEAASIGMAGSTNAPAAIFFAGTLAPELLAAITITAYLSIAIMPVFQPLVARTLTTQKEREVKMAKLRIVSRTERIIFPIAIMLCTGLFIPRVFPLIGMFMLGNLLRECGITEKMQAALTGITTVLLGLGIGSTAYGPDFLQLKTLLIVLLGLAAVVFSSLGGVLFGKIMCALSKGKVNPLIALDAYAAQREGTKYRAGNFLRMHAMGPQAAGLLASALLAGFLSSVPQ